MIEGRIFRRADGSYVLGVTEANPLGSYHATDDTAITIGMVENYLSGLTNKERAEVLIPEPDPPPPIPEELARQARAERDSLLVSVVDRYNAVRWEAMGETERQAVRDYRQALLDWPESAGFPDIATIPVLP